MLPLNVAVAARGRFPSARRSTLLPPDVAVASGAHLPSTYRFMLLLRDVKVATGGGRLLVLYILPLLGLLRERTPA